MQKINSFEEIQVLFKKIRDQRKGIITNFYPDSFRILLWCHNETLSYVCYNGTVFFLRNNGEFNSLYYCSESNEALKNAVVDFLESYDQSILVLELIGDESINSRKDFFISVGFNEYSSLIRMSRSGTPIVKELVMPDSIENAVKEDIPSLLELYDLYFDSYTEQIPVREELIRWIELAHILVYRLDGRIIGFIIYDLIGVTLYLRYWFVHPEYRDQGIGSILFDVFLGRGLNTKRQLLWVIASNENAIKRYLHYGFLQEKMFDFVLIKKI